MSDFQAGAVRRLIRDEGSWLAALAFLLPFEPRRPALELPGFNITALEAVAGLTVLALLWSARRRIPSLLRRPALPLLFVTAYAAAHLLSAAFALVDTSLALRFALRMVAMAALALAVAAQPLRAWRRALFTLVVSAALVATLAVLEGTGVRALDPFLALFREMPFNVGGVRRATAGSEYPNLAAAFLMHGLVVGCALAAPSWRGSALAAAGGLLAGVGLLCTHSRGALVATTLALAALALVLIRARLPARAPMAGLVALVGFVVPFAATSEVFRLRLASEGTTAWYGARYEDQDASLWLRPGQSHLARVRLTNTGTKTWTEREGFRLSYHWYELDRKTLQDGGRTLLPSDVASGESVELHPEVHAPDQPGRYLLVWDMVHEHTAWFSGQGVPPGLVPVAVSSSAAEPPLPVAPPPREEMGWRPARSELWRLAAGMWRERPWTGVGSDNFRRLYGPRARRQFWDVRVYANNTLLEAAATTGILGATALAGTLLASAASAWRTARKGTREARSTAAAVFALSVGLAAHGVVDYVLAFTGHYLLLGLVVGVAAGLVRLSPATTPDPASPGPVLAHP